MNHIRMATVQDIPLLLTFIKELADYEQLLDQVQATEASLEHWMFEKNKAEALIVSCDGQDVGFALFFHSFSTWLGKAGIFLEDLYVRPQARKKGCGKALIVQLAKITKERGCGRLEWNCLNWNEPSIEFYKSLGAQPMQEWTTYRVCGEALDSLASFRTNG